MAASLNKVMLVGRLGKDPEIRSTNNGKQVASFSVATSETWKDKRSGEKQEKTEWHNIVVWNEATVGFLEEYVRKGDLVYVEGQIQTRKWEDKDGNDRYTTEVVVQPFNGAVNLLHSVDGGSNGRDDRDNDRSNDRGNSRRSSRDDRGSNDDRGSSRRSSARRSSNNDDSDRGDDRGDDRGSRRSSRDDKDKGDKGNSSGGKRTPARRDDLDDEIPF